MIEIKGNIPLAPYTIYKIGGPARFLTQVKSSEELKEALDFAATEGISFFILGAGSNVLISDQGFNGLIVRMAGGEVSTDGECLTVGAGAMMARAVMETARSGLAGFEWGIGIPGTIGGSVRGNAGCFGGEMKDVIESVEVFDTAKPATSSLQPAACEFTYRDSIFKRHPEWVILSATFKLQKGDPAAIQGEIRRITAERLTKQDIGAKSCGCIFKNIPWTRPDVNRGELLARFPELARFTDKPTIPVSFLIDAAALKGRRAGRVVISAKHANFFVNEGGAGAEDVIALAVIAKDAVLEKFGLELEEEIQRIGF